MKKVFVSVPCYNEVDNVRPMAEELINLFDTQLSHYALTIQFIDNNSNDGTQDALRKLCKEYPQVRAILNAKNFPLTSGYYNLTQVQGDCAIAIPCDFQVPLDTIPQLLDRWEKGAKIVCLTKKSAEESGAMWQIRQLFYQITNSFSDIHLIRNFTGCGLYDKSFLDVCRKIDDPLISFTQIVATLGYDIETIEYVHEKRKRGRSKNNVFSLFDIAFRRFTSISTHAPRIATYGGMIISAISFIIGCIYLVFKLLFWDNFAAGVAPVLIGVFFMGSIQLFFIGMLGEYIMQINQRLMRRPLVIVKEKINFNDSEETIPNAVCEL